MEVFDIQKGLKGSGTRMKKSIKNDLIVIGIILVLALATWVVMRLGRGQSDANGVAVVTVDGEMYGQYPLGQDVAESIELSDGTYNVFVIKDGEVDMTEASCPDHVCVKHRKISKRNESIVCLPNRVIITIKNGIESDIDSETH